MSEHADIEALSAYVDGEAPEWADHVAGCEACRASADALVTVSDAVGAPVQPADPAMRELAITAALAPPEVTVLHSRRRPSFPARWLIPAVAAMVLVVAGIAATLTLSGRSSSDVTATASAPAADSKTESGPQLAAPGGGALSLAPPASDVGEIPDAAALKLLRDRIGAAGRSVGSLAAAAPAGSGAAVAPASPGPTVPAPAVVGTRPCEEQARARQPSLGPVVYFATAHRQGVATVVLGFSTGPDPAQVTLLMLAPDGCAEVLRAAGS